MTMRLTLPGGLLCFLLASPAPAANEVRQDEKGTYLGALFMSRAQAAPAKTGTSGTTATTKAAAAPGAVITFVLSESPAAKADLRRHDILIGYDKKAIRDGDHLAELIRKDKPNRKVELLVLRGEKKLNVEVTLALGTALKPADREEGRGKTDNRARAQVSVWATPLDTGKVNLTVEYYTAEGNRKTFTCDEAAELTTELRKLPERERNLVRVALQRLKTYSATKDEGGKDKPREKDKK